MSGPADARDAEAGAPLDIPPVAARRPYVRLNKEQTLLECLQDRAVVEYPVLHVALPSELQRFQGAHDEGP